MSRPKALRPSSIQQDRAHHRRTQARGVHHLTRRTKLPLCLGPVADRYFVMEHGRVIDAFANSETRSEYGVNCMTIWAFEPGAAKLIPQEKADNKEERPMKSTCLSALIASLLLTTAAIADDKNRETRELDDQSSLYADSGGPGSVLAVNMAVEDSGLPRQGLDDRRHLRRPPQQAGRRGRHRTPMVRRRQSGRHHRRAEFRHRAGGRRRRQGKRTAFCWFQARRVPI